MSNGSSTQPHIFHGNLRPADLAQVLVAEYNRGNLRAQQIGEGDKIVVQIASRERAAAGGQTALAITIQQVTDGISVLMGNQTWLGVAASLGKTALEAWRNPWNLLGRLDDLAQDIEYLQLSERVWVVIENAARAAGASFELSERLRRLVCGYCSTANPVGQANCIACGAPLGNVQPRTCSQCGFVVKTDESYCPNCKARL